MNSSIRKFPIFSNLHFHSISGICYLLYIGLIASVASCSNMVLAELIDKKDRVVGYERELEATLIPPRENYPAEFDPDDFEDILTIYNDYMDYIAESDFHSIADLMDLSSPLNKWNHRNDVVDNFSFIMGHIFPKYSHAETQHAKIYRDISPPFNYKLTVNRLVYQRNDIEPRGVEVVIQFTRTSEGLKIAQLRSNPQLRSPFE
jgi:hypothetical protein